MKKQSISNCNPLKLPVTVFEKFAKAIDNDELADAASYRSLIGSLLFLAKQTRLDISYGVNILSRLINKPTEAHMQGAKRILRYFHGTSKLKIVYQKPEDPVLLGESDSDRSGDKNDRKSTTRFHLNYGQHGGAI